MLHTSVGEYCFQVYCTSVPDFAHNGAYFLTGFFMNQLLVEQVVEIAIESTANLVKRMIAELVGELKMLESLLQLAVEFQRVVKRSWWLSC